jgi:hypothetical protein
LTKIAAHIKGRLDERVIILVSAIIEFLTQLPASLPGLFVSVSSSRIAEYTFAVNRAQAGQSIAQGPALIKGHLQGSNLMRWSIQSGCFELIVITLLLFRNFCKI